MQRYPPSFQEVIKAKSDDVWVKIYVLGTKTNEKESAQNVALRDWSRCSLKTTSEDRESARIPEEHPEA